MVRHIFTVIVFSLFLNACSRVKNDGTMKVVGADETNENPAVVKIDSGLDEAICTGTFISSDTILTAAHCARIVMTYAGIAPPRLVPHPAFQAFGKPSITSAMSAVDIMILKFDRAVAPATVRIASDAPIIGDKGRIIGFGCSTWGDATSAGTKRAGDVIISNVDSGVIKSTALTVHSCPGDSGGPLFNEKGEQIGVTSTALPEKGGSTWADLTSQAAREFIENAKNLDTSVTDL